MSNIHPLHSGISELLKKPLDHLKYFTILGERCSGTTFIRYAIEWNLGLEYYPTCGKHFFGHDNSVFETEKMKETLVICVVRGPVEWIDSYFKRLHHVVPHNKRSIYNFLNNEFYTIYEVAPLKGEERMDDRHIMTNYRYRNIFELRKVKHEFMLRELPQLVPYSMVLRYEDMREDYDNTLDRILERYNLERLENPYKIITQYKGTYTANYAIKPILLGSREQSHILNSIDREQEAEIGYKSNSSLV